MDTCCDPDDRRNCLAPGWIWRHIYTGELYVVCGVYDDEVRFVQLSPADHGSWLNGIPMTLLRKTFDKLRTLVPYQFIHLPPRSFDTHTRSKA